MYEVYMDGDRVYESFTKDDAFFIYILLRNLFRNSRLNLARQAAKMIG